MGYGTPPFDLLFNKVTRYERLDEFNVYRLARSCKTEPVPAKRNPFRENRARSGKTDPVLGKQSLKSKKRRQSRFPGTAAQWTGLLGADERFAVHPIGVTAQLAERTDLEVIDSSHGQASDDGFL